MKESVNKILMEAQSEGVQVRPYTENVFAVGNNSGVKFYVDRNGRFYDGNMQPTKNVACLTDYDAQQVANQLNKALGNMFHYDMFRGGLYAATINPTLISDHLRTSPIDLSNIWANRSDSLIFLVFQRYTASSMYC